MNPVAFTVGGFEVRWYSLFILLGIIISWILISKEAKKFKIENDFITNMLFWVIIFGIIGARIYYCIFEDFSYYSKNIIEVFKVWKGGLAIHGGILVGGITLISYCKKYKVSVYRMLDICAPYLLFAQAIGRWGNFFNGEIYGSVTSYEKLHSLKFIPEFVINGMNNGGVYYTPLFYYESLWCLLGFIILIIIRKLKYTRLGFTTGGYLIWYSIGRFVFEGMRNSTFNLMLGNIKVAQLASIIMFIIGFMIILLQSRKPKLTEMYNSKEKVEVINF